MSKVLVISPFPSIFVGNFEHVFVSWEVLLVCLNIVCCILKLLYGRKGKSVPFIFCPLFDTFPGGLPKGTKDWVGEGDIKFVDG